MVRVAAFVVFELVAGSAMAQSFCEVPRPCGELMCVSIVPCDDRLRALQKELRLPKKDDQRLPSNPKL
jgi:hypothetical protein